MNLINDYVINYLLTLCVTLCNYACSGEVVKINVNLIEKVREDLGISRRTLYHHLHKIPTFRDVVLNLDNYIRFYENTKFPILIVRMKSGKRRIGRPSYTYLIIIGYENVIQFLKWCKRNVKIHI